MKRILVIDDNEDIRSFLASVLGEFGFQVDIAGNGQDALRLIESDMPDLIISDIDMPEVDGYALLGAVRDMPGAATVPFILMTGAASKEGFRRGMVSGADDYLPKPFTVTDIVEAVLSRMARQEEWKMERYERIYKFWPRLIDGAAPALEPPKNLESTAA